MIVTQFVCPFQTSETFSFSVCLKCSCYTMNLGKKMSVSCKKNRKIRANKIGFETAFYLNELGMPYRVELLENDP